jgi:DUF917 family protein
LEGEPIMKIRLETKEQFEDLARGLTLFGTGGGGQPEKGLHTILSEQEEGKVVSLIDVNELADDEWTACAWLMGTIAYATPERKAEMKLFGLDNSKSSTKVHLARAIKELERYTGKTIKAIIPPELGGENTLTAIATASYLGLSVVDGDYIGRAAPEITQNTPMIMGKCLWPIACVDAWGDICIITEAHNELMAERIGKFLSVAAFGTVGQCAWLMKGSETKSIIVRDTISRSLRVGKVIRQARLLGKNPVQEAVSCLNGWILFKGNVIGVEAEDRNGYYWGTYFLQGIEEWGGSTFKVWFKNENHITWINDVPFVTSPDIIAAVDLESAEPITNADISVGSKVAVIGTKAANMLRTSRGLELMGPSYFGYLFDYKPIESLMMNK